MTERPVYLGGAEAGRLTLAREGLYLVLRADCEARPGLVRLWLHGAGGSAYLGLLRPEAGRLTLTRRYSRAEAAALPAVAYASDEADGRGAQPAGPAPPRPSDAARPAAAPRGTADAVLLPCAPGVPGAVEIGGRCYLAISLSPRYNKIFPADEGGTGHADERSDREKT